MTAKLRLTKCIIILATGLCACNSRPPDNPGIPGVAPPAVDGQTRYDAIELRPARTGWLPGFVFRGTVADNAVLVEEVVCNNLYPTAKPEYEDAVYTTITTDTSIEGGLSLDLLKKLVRDNKVNIDVAKLSSERKFSSDYGKVQYIYFPITVQFDGQEARPIPAECQRAIEILKQDEQFDNSVWIITGVTAATGLKYRFETATEAGSSLDVELAKLLTLTGKLGYDRSTSEGITTIATEKPVVMRIAQPILVKKWVRSGSVSGQERATILGEQEARPIKEITAPADLPAVDGAM